MDLIDEQKIASVIVNPLIDRLLKEVIPALDKMLQDKIDQLKSTKISFDYKTNTSLS